MATKRHRNDGLRKVCGCARAKWPKCKHSWFINYTPRNPARHKPKTKDGGWRLSLDRVLHRHIDSKSEAKREAERIKGLIDDGKFGPQAVLSELTVAQLLDHYVQKYVTNERKAAVKGVEYQVGRINKVEIDHPNGVTEAFGQWQVADVTVGALGEFKAKRQQDGVVTTNRDLAFLRACWNWAIAQDYVEKTPFKKGTKTVVTLTKEHARTRRLEPGELERLLPACPDHLRAVVEAALATGCRSGELLSLQWEQVQGMLVNDDRTITWQPKAQVFLPAQKTKTKKARWIPITARLRAILEMRRFDPKNKPHKPDAYVFGNEVGEQIGSIKKGWSLACERAGIDDLHFHDLRREAGSRWLEAGLRLHEVQRLLGHANVSQTSTYLAATSSELHDALARIDDLQQLATEAGNQNQTNQSTATNGRETSNKTTTGGNPTIM